MDEHESHRPETGSWRGQLISSPHGLGQRHCGSDEPGDDPDSQDPRRRTRQHHEQADENYGQREVARAKRPNSYSPVPVVLQFWRLPHGTDCCVRRGCAPSDVSSRCRSRRPEIERARHAAIVVAAALCRAEPSRVRLPAEEHATEPVAYMLGFLRQSRSHLLDWAYLRELGYLAGPRSAFSLRRCRRHVGRAPGLHVSDQPALAASLSAKASRRALHASSSVTAPPSPQRTLRRGA